MNFSGLVVGLGQIGLGYDHHDRSHSFVASHAKAFHLHPAFSSVDAVDPESSRRQMFSDRYGGTTYSNIRCALEHCKPDVAVVATPTTHHAENFYALLECASLRLILCEKPMTTTLSEAVTMLEAARRKHISVAVNYIRRYDPGIRNSLSRIRSGELGYPLKACVWYRKGIFNNGSHLLNLLLSVLGRVERVQVISKGRLWDGWDPEPDLKVVFQQGEAYFMSGSEDDFSYHQMELVGPVGKVLYDKDDKIFWWGIGAGLSFPDHNVLWQQPEKIVTDMKRYQYNVLQNVADFLDGHAPLFCDGVSGLETLQALDMIQAELL